ncbi:thiamine phosphate synthase [uncultured Finegoldia sp.]|uniref:thiamine phosphate synthase n=1 Tax=uncultured Finegoldia sp. TaxID=328009 RepID=UPI002603D150|nr:thiamine phosphate synthase [uncultured Finegoldia sp.]
MKKSFNLGLSLITNKQTLKGRDLSETIEIALKNGADSVRLREKNLNTREIMQETFKIKEITQRLGKLLIVNDRVDIAKACDVDGVHLGQKDMPIKYAREILGEDKIIGISCHTLEQALEAQENGADYIGVGAIFPTFTEDNFIRVTIETLNEIAEKIHIPITAIGGINKNNIKKIFNCNVDSVSLTSAIFSTEDVQLATRELREIFDKIIEK